MKVFALSREGGKDNFHCFSNIIPYSKSNICELAFTECYLSDV